MCNERNDSISYTVATCEVYTFKNKNKGKLLRDTSLLYLFILYICTFVIMKARAYDIAHGENVMSSLIIQSI